MSKHTRDGHPIAYGSIEDRLTGKYGGFSVACPVECVVDKAYYPDDKANTSKKYMEYSVVILTTKTVIPNVRQVVSGGGFADGDYNVLQETTGTVDNPNNPKFDRKKTDSSKWNGDRVLVVFVGGNQNVPVITGVLPHPATKYGGKRDQGKKRLTTLNGTTVLIDKDGNATLTVKEKKKLTLKSNKVSIAFDDDGEVVTLAADKLKATIDAKNKKISAETQSTSVVLDDNAKKAQVSASFVELGGNTYPTLNSTPTLTDLADMLSDLIIIMAAGTVGSPVKQQLVAFQGLQAKLQTLQGKLAQMKAYQSTVVSNG